MLKIVILTVFFTDLGVLYQDDEIDGSVLNVNGSKKDVSKYHSWYKIIGRDAMGVSNIHRGFSDDSLFASMTTQSKVAGMTLKQCKKIKKAGKRQEEVCQEFRQKWTYAIPLEVIYLNPLSKWNPYNLKYHGNYNYKSVATANGRYGDCNQNNNKELNGTNSKRYYQTPVEFFSGGDVGKTKADTVRDVSCVLDRVGVSRKVRASGIYPFIPNIHGVGTMRQRFPVFPVHGEGSSVWKELNALKEIVMNQEKWKHMFQKIDDYTNFANNETELVMSLSKSARVAGHTHSVILTEEEALKCKEGREVVKETSTANGHSHNLIIKWSDSNAAFYYRKCDRKPMCWDKHLRPLFIDDNER